MSNPLPNVIGQIASSVASVANSLQPVVIPDESKPMLILISKDLSADDAAELSAFGSVVVWKEAWKNIPFAQLQKCDYLVVDIRLADARQQLAKEDTSKYNVVHYVRWFQRIEDYIKKVPGAIITDVPMDCSSKSVFDQQLLNEPLVEPSAMISILKFFGACGAK